MDGIRCYPKRRKTNPMAIQQEDNRLERIKAIHRLTSMDEWKILEEDCSNLSNLFIEELIKTKPDNATRINYLQVAISFYKNISKTLVESYKKEEELLRYDP